MFAGFAEIRRRSDKKEKDIQTVRNSEGNMAEPRGFDHKKNRHRQSAHHEEVHHFVHGPNQLLIHVLVRDPHIDDNIQPVFESYC